MTILLRPMQFVTSKRLETCSESGGVIIDSLQIFQ
jgi:hypothetical protein